MKGSEAQIKKPYKLLWMLWFEEKSISNLGMSDSSITYKYLGSIYLSFELLNEVPDNWNHFSPFS